jgi:hypothetical protein
MTIHHSGPLERQGKISGFGKINWAGEHMAIVVSRPDARQHGVPLSVMLM